MEYTRLVNLIGIPIGGAIVLAFGLSVYWNMRACILSSNIFYRKILIYMVVASAMIAGAYLYLFIHALMGIFSETTLFGAAIIRPILLFLGFSSASIARYRYTAIQRGGEEWTFPKLKM
jgi:hypothetical protein